MNWSLGVKEALDLRLYCGSEAVIHEHKRIALIREVVIETHNASGLTKEAFKADRGQSL